MTDKDETEPYIVKAAEPMGNQLAAMINVVHVRTGHSMDTVLAEKMSPPDRMLVYLTGVGSIIAGTAALTERKTGLPPGAVETFRAAAALMRTMADTIESTITPKN